MLTIGAGFASFVTASRLSGKAVTQETLFAPGYLFFMSTEHVRLTSLAACAG